VQIRMLLERCTRLDLFVVECSKLVSDQAERSFEGGEWGSCSELLALQWLRHANYEALGDRLCEVAIGEELSKLRHALSFVRQIGHAVADGNNRVRNMLKLLDVEALVNSSFQLAIPSRRFVAEFHATLKQHPHKLFVLSDVLVIFKYPETGFGSGQGSSEILFLSSLNAKAISGMSLRLTVGAQSSAQSRDFEMMTQKECDLFLHHLQILNSSAAASAAYVAAIDSCLVLVGIVNELVPI
jgi:hypothetical protein